MPKRVLVIFVAILAGFGLAQLASRQHGAPSWWPDRERDKQVRYFRDVLQIVKENYVGDAPADYSSLTRAALDGMVSQLDPHSQFLQAEEYAETEDELTNAFTGVGIQVEQRDGHIVIVAAIPATPAERAGLRRGDQLVKIDGQDLVEPTLDSTIKLVRGAPGSQVSLTVFRPSQNRNFDYTVRRERIQLASVRLVSVLPGNVGYLQLTQFSDRTGDEFHNALTGLEQDGITSLVIDLRNNPGGLLEAAIAVCDEFFDKGELIVYTQGRTPQSRENHFARGDHPKRTYPVALLVNGGTASAAEIVAGAMRDTHRAVIVGEKTFGKGSVQSVIELDNGEGLRLTTARYYTPSGVTIHEKGIAPHAEIEVSADDEARVRLQQTRADDGDTEESKDKPIADVQLAAAEEILAGVLAAEGPESEERANDSYSRTPAVALILAGEGSTTGCARENPLGPSHPQDDNCGKCFGFSRMILALESSCDETAVALFDPATGLKGEWIHSQIALHEAYGGVVPDLASREHLAHFGPLLARALAVAHPGDVKRIVVTQGPGLAACLAMGLAAAKSLGVAWQVPVAGVNHLRAHAFSPFIALHAADPGAFDAEFAKLLPHLGLLVSGGNTALFTIDESRHITLLASTMDDAAGEALDKGAKLLGLGYPGGPQVEKLAANGKPDAFAFPKALAQRSTLEFSFSGLKTSLRYQLEKMPAVEIERRKADLCASYQAAVFDALVRKSKLALEQNVYRSFGLSGGVANNRTLQALLEKAAQSHNLPFFRAQPQHTGDNAGMIAFAAWADREAGGVNDAGIALEIAPSLPLAMG